MEPIKREHVHGCPECYEKVPCAMDCSVTEADDLEAPDRGGFVICDKCEQQRLSQIQADEVRKWAKKQFSKP